MTKSKLIRKIDAKWNDLMYSNHPTPYAGLAGIVERIRVRSVLKAAKVINGQRILEIGCEAGNLLVSFPVKTILTGFDISNLALINARTNFNKLKRTATFVQGDAMSKLPFKVNDFDVIICSETLEHVKDPLIVVSNIAEICSEKTKIIFTVPNETPKIYIKSILNKLGILKFIMPSIETGQSEWHLHAFSDVMFRSVLSTKFNIISLNSILGLHFVAVVKKR